jgi:hypothetical protein
MTSRIPSLLDALASSLPPSQEFESPLHQFCSACGTRVLGASAYLVTIKIPPRFCNLPGKPGSFKFFAGQRDYPCPGCIIPCSPAHDTLAEFSERHTSGSRWRQNFFLAHEACESPLCSSVSVSLKPHHLGSTPSGQKPCSVYTIPKVGIDHVVGHFMSMASPKASDAALRRVATGELPRHS